MPPFADSAKNLMLDALDEAVAGFLSLHTAYSASGANEVTGGSPAYARKACVWNAASAGSKALSANVAFDVPTATTVRFIGIWSAVTAGTFYGMVPNGSTGSKVVSVDDSNQADVFRSPAHGFTALQAIVFFGAALPTGITAGTTYYIKTTGLDTDFFQVTAAADDGIAIALTSNGSGIAQLVVPETFGAQGTFTVQAASTSLDLNVL
jgi:hypothetical protein